jgi:hypothetical protein
LRALLFTGLLAAALAAAVAVPAASAKSFAVKLSVLPLQKAQLGAAKSLPLQPDSGVISDAAAAGYSFTASSSKTLTKLGRITGYGLDYGIGASGGSGATETGTRVEEYKTAADAKNGLAFWKKDDAWVSQLNQGGFAVSNSSVKVPAIGGSRFADLASYSSANIVPVANLDEQFTDGRYELDVSVWSSTVATAKSTAASFAKKLDARLRQALAGKLHATPAALPKQHPGAPTGGPDLSGLALQPSDLSGSATVKSQGYYVDPSALSDYGVFMLPAGPFALLTQDAEWYATTNQAAFEADLATAVFAAAGGSSVDLSSVGDGAQGADATDSNGSFAQIVFSTGHLAEFVSVASQAALQASDLQSVAQSAANRINTAGLGS